jgi:outer membrane receptor protein involved in Fe transport
MINMRLKYRLFLVIVLVVSTVAVHAQRRDTLNSMTIINPGTYVASIIDANKINDNPVVVDSTKKLAVKGYSINSKKMNTNYTVAPIEAAEMVGEPLTKLYNALVKIGIGNYKTPYGEVWYNSLRSKEMSYGIRLKHLSSSATLKNYGFAGYSDNEISLYGKKFLKEHTLSGNFDYARNVVHFYGYDASLFNITDNDFTAQRFHYVAANAELMSHYTKAERYNHDIKLSYYNLSDLYKTSESNVKLNGFVKTAINKELLKVNAAVDYYNYKTASDTVNNTILSLNPNFIADGDVYHASIGVTVAMDVFVKSKFYFYPAVDLSYNVFENIIIPYVGATGGIQKNSFKSLTDTNPFLLSQVAMNNTNKKYEVYGGLKGTLSSTVAYNARASYSSIGQMALFVNDSRGLLNNRYDVIYDDATLLNVRGEVSYQQREKLRINLRGDYFNYKMKTEKKAWYTPQLEITLSANYNLQDKIVAKVALFYMDKQFAKVLIDDELNGDRVEMKELKGVVDANIGLEYRYTKKLSFFLNVNNIGNFRYYRYNNYPSQRIQFMAGLSYSF